MADQETQSELPVVIGGAPTDDALNTLRVVKDSMLHKTFQSVNAVAAPPSNKVFTLPKLPESQQVGYTAGVKKDITCCTIGPFLVEKNAAYDYIMMANAAALVKVSLPIHSAFRSWDEQKALEIERSNPAVAKVKGVAAKAGFSNHQSGVALDLAVGMTKADYIAGRFTAEYLWLVSNAAQFGFDHDEGAKVNEPWHWTHLSYTVKGVPAFQAVTGFTVDVAATAGEASSSSSSGVQLFLAKETHDVTTALARNKDATQSSRSDLNTANAVFKFNQTNGVGSYVADAKAAQQTLLAPPKPFDRATLSRLVYDFTTGLWGDGKPV